MTERDQILLDALDNLALQFCDAGLCPSSIKTMKCEVMRIMGERDGLAHSLERRETFHGCPYYIRNKHDRGDDSLCRFLGCEVKNMHLKKCGG